MAAAIRLRNAAFGFLPIRGAFLCFPNAMPPIAALIGSERASLKEQKSPAFQPGYKELNDTHPRRSFAS
ncbi:MAG: hypothetical protein IJ165_07875 [Proteobacteria bacterium]|nr:hypothetical protein [Pseudomonadota bacterium]